MPGGVVSELPGVPDVDAFEVVVVGVAWSGSTIVGVAAAAAGAEVGTDSMSSDWE